MHICCDACVSDNFISNLQLFLCGFLLTKLQQSKKQLCYSNLIKAL